MAGANSGRLRSHCVSYQMRRLTECGTYVITRERWAYVQQIRLTELGERIVATYRAELKSGARMRWPEWVYSTSKHERADDHPFAIRCWRVS